jgi:RHS repeat-associated protein
MTLDVSGNVLGRQAHLPFGEDFGQSGTQEKHHFTSYERDSEIATDYAVNRQYSSNIGRFMSADPYSPSNYLEDPRSWNRYSYTRNVLTNRVDPIGLMDIGAGDVIAYIARNPGKPNFRPDPDPFPGAIGWGPGLANLDGKGGGVGDLGKQAPPIAPFPTRLRRRIHDLLDSNNRDCGNFAQKLIDQAAKDRGSSFSPDVNDIIGMIDSQGGYVFQPPNVQGYPTAAGTTSGSLAGGNATVIIGPLPEPLSTTDHGRLMNQYFYIETALHETLHLAAFNGIYTDADLAIAAVHLGGLSNEDLAYFDSLDVTNKAQMSGFFDYVLQKHCPRP